MIIIIIKLFLFIIILTPKSIVNGHNEVFAAINKTNYYN